MAGTFVPKLLALAFFVVWMAGALATDAVDTAGLPHIDSCNYCMECIPSTPASRTSRHHHRSLRQDPGLGFQQATTTGDEAASRVWADEPDEAYAAAASASGIPGALSNPHQVMPELIAPPDHEQKQLKPNCTRCTGCTSVLTDMHAEPVQVQAEGLGPLVFMHGKGATNGWLFFGRVAGSTKRYIVKVYCMPYSKMHGRPQDCASDVYTERMRLMMAQVRLTDECGASGLTPRVFVAPVNAIIPNGSFIGYHVRWHGLWMEEAPGITLHGLWHTQGYENIMYDLLARKLNKTQVIQQTVMDLLTAQCDRHSENVFITDTGQLSFIDNDRALGVVTRCGSDSMLLPGNRYHTQLRLGYWGPTLEYYQKHSNKPGFCTGPIDMRVIIDYRCMVPNGVIGTDYPTGLKECMKALARHRVPAIMQRYGFTSRKPAEILKRRSRDMLGLGFEGALAQSPPRSGPRYVYTPQPACCGVVMDIRGTPKCAQCWKPVLEEQKIGVRDTGPAARQVEKLVEPHER